MTEYTYHKRFDGVILTVAIVRWYRVLPKHVAEDLESAVGVPGGDADESCQEGDDSVEGGDDDSEVLGRCHDTQLRLHALHRFPHCQMKDR